MSPYRVLILGGYGVFGGRLARLLSQEDGFEIFIAGRNKGAAEAFCTTYHRAGDPSPMHATSVSTFNEIPHILDTNDIDLIINCVGPYQNLDYTISEAAIAAGIDYLDLADGREFVSSFDQLDEQAKSTGAIAITGASTLPAVSSAVADHLIDGLTSIDAIEIAIAPGLRMPRGVAVIRAILGYTGKAVPVWQDNNWVTMYGWQSLKRRRLKIGHQDTGPRWLGICDVPDLTLFPHRYPNIKTVTFRAGLELAPLHFGLWLMSWLVRLGLVASLEPLARPFRWLAELIQPLGSDRGGMFVDVTGTNKNNNFVRRTWTLVADSGHGPWIPILPALILTRKLKNREITEPGAYACMGFFDLDTFQMETAAFDIWTEVGETNAAR